MTTVTSLRGRHLLTLNDYSADEIIYLLDLSAELKEAKRDRREEQHLRGKNIALIFEKDSTRTRCAFEVAAYDQDAHVTYLGPTGSHIGGKESVKSSRSPSKSFKVLRYCATVKRRIDPFLGTGRKRACMALRLAQSASSLRSSWLG